MKRLGHHGLLVVVSTSSSWSSISAVVFVPVPLLMSVIRRGAAGAGTSLFEDDTITEHQMLAPSSTVLLR
jgi:hypothetical protein